MATPFRPVVDPLMQREPDFEESADMRLVELQRAALGVAKPELGAWNSRAASEGGAGESEPAEQVLRSAVVALELTASPPGGVIPGAIVTLALSVTNEGSMPARDLIVSVPLPGGAAYRNGSLIRDGRAVLDESAEELFGAGLRTAELAAKSRLTLVWKIGVRLGNKPLVIAPTARAEKTAIVGARTLLISRKDGANAAFATEVQRVENALPIYELDQEEQLEHEAALAALSPAAEYQMPTEAPVPSEPGPAQPEPAPPPSQPEPGFEPGVPDPEPSMPSPPEQPPDMEPAALRRPAAAGREAVVLHGRIDRPSVAYFDRLFNGSKAATLLTHFMFGGALACTGAAEPGGLEAHMQAQARLLQRLMLHERIGKKEPIAQYTGAMIARVDGLRPSRVVAQAPLEDASAILLEAELELPALALLRKMQDESARWDFTKARQLTLALQARRIVARTSPERIEAAEAALRGYAQVAGTQLHRFFVRMRLDRTTGLLFTPDETLDAAARTLVAALTVLF
ncbi:MAG: hypothetical protein ABR508_02465 [Candidatus Baltobacteraceae bacterium]